MQDLPWGGTLHVLLIPNCTFLHCILHLLLVNCPVLEHDNYSWYMYITNINFEALVSDCYYSHTCMYSSYRSVSLLSYISITLVIHYYHFSYTLVSLQSYIRYVVIHLSYFSHSWVLPWRRFDMLDFPYCFRLLLQGMRSPVLSVQNNYHSYREIQMQGGGKIGKEYLCSDLRKS
jgi:hypothetical protein